MNELYISRSDTYAADEPRDLVDAARRHLGAQLAPCQGVVRVHRYRSLKCLPKLGVVISSQKLFESPVHMVHHHVLLVVHHVPVRVPWRGQRARRKGKHPLARLLEADYGLVHARANDALRLELSTPTCRKREVFHTREILTRYLLEPTNPTHARFSAWIAGSFFSSAILFASFSVGSRD